MDMRVCPDDVPEAVRIIEQSCLDAGEYYNMRVPIVADCALGFNWYDVH